jgi:hypothetical protein
MIMDCRKREGIEAKGMERKWVTPGLSRGARPVRAPNVGCVNVWGVKVAMSMGQGGGIRAEGRL